MIGPNLSEWALRTRQLTIYMMIVGVIAGAFAFINLGRDEDPSFTIKTMLVTAVWPGATMEETQTQLTDRLERRLEETTGLDALRSITRPGIVTIYRRPAGGVPLGSGAGRLAGSAQQDRRHPPYPAAGRAGAFLQRQFRRRIRHHLCLYR